MSSDEDIGHGEEMDLDSIASTVLHRGIPDPDRNKMRESESIILKYGAKSLSVWIDTVDRRIGTDIESTEDVAKPYETTVLYLAAKKFMQQAVDALGLPYQYALSTKNERMQAWARGPGAEIFKWTASNDTSNGLETYSSFTTTFKPEGYIAEEER